MLFVSTSLIRAHYGFYHEKPQKTRKNAKKGGPKPSAIYSVSAKKKMEGEAAANCRPLAPSSSKFKPPSAILLSPPKKNLKKSSIYGALPRNVPH